MIALTLAPEPAHFEEQVRRPGKAFLALVQKPTTKQFNSHAYWRRVLRDLHRAYRGICAYSCHWIPCDTGADTVEHFRPKSVAPELAYEWANYRLTSATLNGRKGDKEDVLDPMSIQSGWFRIEFPSLLVKPGEAVPPDTTKEVLNTIKRLGLNHEFTCVESRAHYVQNYCLGRITWAYLQDHAPFLAAEIERQGLKGTLSTIMQFEQVADS